MNLFYILEAICDKVHAEFPVSPIYIQQMPQGFKRPSFYVSIIAFNDTDLSNTVLKRNTAFQVTFFAPVDARNTVDVVSQYSSYMALAQIFQHQGLQVKDRNIKITSVEGGPRDAEVYLTINFEYAYQPEDFVPADELYELIQELNIKYN